MCSSVSTLFALPLWMICTNSPSKTPLWGARISLLLHFVKLFKCRLCIEQWNGNRWLSNGDGMKYDTMNPSRFLQCFEKKIHQLFVTCRAETTKSNPCCTLCTHLKSRKGNEDCSCCQDIHILHRFLFLCSLLYRQQCSRNFAEQFEPHSVGTETMYLSSWQQ